MTVVTAAKNESRTERNKREKRARILRAARQLFERKGFDGATMREIAANADIGHGTLFLYANSKEDLLVAMFREECGRAVDDAIATLPRRGPVVEQLLHILGALLAHHERNVALARVFVKELPFVSDARHGVAEFMANLLGHMTELITTAQASGELDRDVAATLLALNVFAIFYGNLQRWLGQPRISAAECKRGIRDGIELQFAGLQPKRRRPTRR
jgi:AcrR family transcriptional regulator